MRIKPTYLASLLSLTSLYLCACASQPTKTPCPPLDQPPPDLMQPARPATLKQLKQILGQP